MRAPEHHVLFYARMWRSMEDYKVVRECKWLKPPLVAIGHTALHGEISLVPLPDRHCMQRVRATFEPVPGDYLGSIDNVMLSIDRALTHPRATELDKQLGYLTIQAIEMQLPFIREYLVE